MARLQRAVKPLLTRYGAAGSRTLSKHAQNLSAAAELQIVLLFHDPRSSA